MIVFSYLDVPSGFPEQEEQSIQELLELGVDGLIIFPAQGEYFSDEILKLVVNKFPFVLITGT